MKPKFAFRSSLGLTLASALFMTYSAQALTWDSDTGATDNWSTAATNTNWDSGVDGVADSLWIQNSDAVFSEAAETVTVTTNNNFNNITFGLTGYIIGNGAGNLDIDSTDNASSITVTNAADSATINEVIRNNAGGATAGSLEKLGAGTLTLTNGNTFSGGLTITAGTVTSTAAQGFGNGGSTVTVGAAGTAIVTLGADLNVDNIFTGSGILTVNGSTGTPNFNNAAGLNGFTGTFNVNTTGGKKVALTTAGGKIGSGATVNISSGGTLFIANTTASFDGVTFNVAGTGNTENLGAIRIDSSSVIGATSSIVLGGNSSLGTQTGTGTINAPITQSTTSGITKVGAGTLVLGASNSYLGGTTLNAGTLGIGNANALGTGTFTINVGNFDNTSGGALAIGNTIVTDVQQLYNFTATNDLTFNGTVTINNGVAPGTNTGIQFAVNTAGKKLILNNTLAYGGYQLEKGGAGTLVLNAAGTGGGKSQTHGGVTADTTLRLSAGVLELGNAAAFGTGRFAVLGASTLQSNTALTGVNKVTNEVTLASNLTLAGSNNLELGGVVTNGGGDRTLTIGNAGSTTISGNVNLSDATGTGRTLTVSNSTAATISGTIRNYGAGAGTAGGFTKLGTGTLTLSGPNTYTGGTRANAGILMLSGSHSGGSFFSVNNVGAQNAAVKIASGAGTYSYTADLNQAEATNARGAIYQEGGTFSTGNVFRIASGTGSYGYYSLSSGGTVTNAAGDMLVGSGSGSTGVMDVTGGSVTTGSWIVLGRNGGTASGLLNVTGGSVTSNSNNIGLDWGGTSGAISMLNVGGGAGAASVTGVSNAANYLDVSVANVTGQTGVVNLRANGTLTVAKVQAGGAASTALFNFDGGTLKATAANAGTGFMTSGNMDAVTVYSGGGTIDNRGTGITISNALAAATGNGVSSIGITNKGSGYIGAPLVTITGGTGNPATGYAVMADDGTGNGTYKVDSIVITSPGTYTVAPTTVNLSGGGATTAASGFTINTAANTSGGMTFTSSTGSGTTTLSGTNTYTGATLVSSGTLQANGTNVQTFGALSGTSGITVSNGATLAANENGLFGWGGTGEKDITVNSGGILTAATGVNVNVRVVTLNGGTMSNGGAAATWGSWTFRHAGDKLLVTDDSIVSAQNVFMKTGSPIEVASGKTLNFTGTLTDANSDGTGAVVKDGAGKVVLVGSSTYTGTTTINAGILQVGNGNGATLGNGNYGGAISGTGTLAFNSTAAQTLGGAITGGTNLTKDGSGTLTLTNTAALGAVTLTNGSVGFNNTTTAGATSVADGASLSVKSTAAGTSALTTTSLTLGSSGATSLSLDFNSLNPTVPLIATGTLTANGSITLNLGGTGGLNSATYKLIDYTTLGGSFANFTPTSFVFGHSSGSLIDNTANTSVDLQVTADAVVWSGASGTGEWKTAATGDNSGLNEWATKNGHAATNFWANDAVEFGDTYQVGAGSPVSVTNRYVLLTSGDVSPSGVAFSNSTGDYTIAADTLTGIIGAGGITKTGTSKATLVDLKNTYTGATNINGGILNIQGSSGLGASSMVTVASGTALELENGVAIPSIPLTLNGTGVAASPAGALRSLGGLNSYAGTIALASNSTVQTDTDLTLSGIISGTGMGLTKNGTGKLSLSSANTYTGGTIINSGILQIGTTAGAANTGTFTLAGGTLQVSQAGNDFNFIPAINVTAAGSTFSNAGTGQINYNGALNGNGNALNFSSNTARLYMNGTVTNLSQFNVIAGAMGFDINNAHNRGTAPVVVSNGASLWVAGNTTNPITNPLTFNGGTGQGGVGALYYEGGAPNPAAITSTITLNSGDTSVGGQFAADTITLSGNIGGTGSLTKISGDTYVLTGAASNYSGGTTIAAGVLRAGSNSALGSGPASVSAVAGAQLQLAAGVNVGNTLTINGGGVGSQGIVYVPTGDATYSGAITITGAQSAGGDFAAATGTLTLSGVITSASQPVDSRIGTVVFANAGNSFGNLIVGAGTAKYGVTNGIPAGTTVTLGASAAATLDLAGFNGSLAGITKGANAATVTNSGATDATLTTTGTSTFAGVIQNGGTNKTALTVNGGALTLTAANTHTGDTTISAGTLFLGAAGTVAASPVKIGAGAILDTTAKTTFSRPVSSPAVTFSIAAAGSGSAGKIQAAGLDITNISANFNAVGTLDDAVYVIADYTGTLVGTAFASVTNLPTGYSLNYAYNGGTQIALVQDPVGGYASWRTAFGPADVGAAGADYENDGFKNAAEYILAGSPVSGSDNPKIYSFIADSDDASPGNDLIITIPVPVGTPDFPVGSPTSSVTFDGLVITVRGSTDLNSFPVTVTPTTKKTAGLPAENFTKGGITYKYVSFALNGSNGTPAKGFLQVTVTIP